MILSVIQHLLFIICVNTLVFAKTMAYTGASDDLAAFNRKDREARNWFERRWFHIIGTRIYSFQEAHLWTFGLHTLVCVMIYFAFGASDVSCMTSMLFGVSPANTHVSVWCSGKPYSLNAIGVLLMFIVPILAPFAYGLSLLAAPSSVFLFIPFMLKFDWIFLAPIALAIPFAVIHIKRHIREHKAYMRKETMKPGLNKLVVAVKTYGYYFRFVIAPNNLAWDNGFLWNYGTTKTGNRNAYRINRDFWWGIISLSLVIGAIIYFGWNSPVGYGLIWWLSGITLWNNFIAVHGRTTSRYQYLAAMGMYYAIAYLCYTYCMPLFFIGLGLFMAKTFISELMYSCAYWHIQFMCIEDTNNRMGWVRQGVDAINRRDIEIGRLYLEEARKIDEDFVVLFDLAWVYLFRGDLRNARIFMEMARPNFSDRIADDFSECVKLFDKTLLEAEEAFKTNGKYDIREYFLLNYN